MNFQQMATWNLWYVFLGSSFHFAMGLVSLYDTQEEGRSRSRRTLRDWVMLDMLDASVDGDCFTGRSICLLFFTS